jgi:hypothetical protein
MVWKSGIIWLYTGILMAIQVGILKSGTLGSKSNSDQRNFRITGGHYVTLPNRHRLVGVLVLLHGFKALE